MIELIFKVLTADDDEGMRLVLRKAVEKLEGFELAGEAADGESALRLAESIKPHIIFMDVEMPVMNGIECAGKIMDINPKTFIIFATAHEEYMSEAFRVYAFDYLVKPFNIKRIHQTLERIRELSTSPSYAGEYVDIIKSGTAKKQLGKLMIRSKEAVSLVDTEEIIFIQREERNTAIYTREDRYVTSESLGDMEERLDPSLFFRCHKSYIINLSMISRIYPYGRWTYIVKLKNTEKDALMTHDRFAELEKMFK